MNLEIKARHLVPLKYIYELQTELIFELKEDRLEIYFFDDSACMLMFTLEKSNFVRYDRGEDFIAVDLKTLKPLLQKFNQSPDSIVSISTKDNLVFFEFFEKRYRIGQLEAKPEERRIPHERVSPSSCIITPAKLIEFITDKFIKENSSISFELKEDNLNLLYTDEPNELKESIMVLSSTAMSDNCSKYSVSYLSKMIYPLAEKIELEFEKDSFLRIAYLTPDFNLVYWLAPRVEND